MDPVNPDLEHWVRPKVGLVGGAGGLGGGQDLPEAGAAHLHTVVQTCNSRRGNTGTAVLQKFSQYCCIPLFKLNVNNSE